MSVFLSQVESRTVVLVYFSPSGYVDNLSLAAAEQLLHIVSVFV